MAWCLRWMRLAEWDSIIFYLAVENNTCRAMGLVWVRNRNCLIMTNHQSWDLAWDWRTLRPGWDHVCTYAWQGINFTRSYEGIVHYVYTVSESRVPWPFNTHELISCTFEHTCSCHVRIYSLACSLMSLHKFEEKKERRRSDTRQPIHRHVLIWYMLVGGCYREAAPSVAGCARSNSCLSSRDIAPRLS